MSSRCRCRRRYGPTRSSSARCRRPNSSRPSWPTIARRCCATASPVSTTSRCSTWQSNPAILRALYAQAGVFSAFGSRLRIRDGRVVTPGEDAGRSGADHLGNAGRGEDRRARALHRVVVRAGARAGWPMSTTRSLSWNRRASRSRSACGSRIPELRLPQARALAWRRSRRISRVADAAASVRPAAARLRSTLLTAVSRQRRRQPALARPRGGSGNARSRAQDLARRSGAGAPRQRAQRNDRRGLARADHRDERRPRARTAADAARVRVPRVRRRRARTKPSDVLVALRAFTRYRTAMLGARADGHPHSLRVYATAARQAEALGPARGQPRVRRPRPVPGRARAHRAPGAERLGVGRLAPRS